jgi:hypothetical protein
MRAVLDTNVFISAIAVWRKFDLLNYGMAGFPIKTFGNDNRETAKQ